MDLAHNVFKSEASMERERQLEHYFERPMLNSPAAKDADKIAADFLKKVLRRLKRPRWKPLLKLLG